MSSGYFRVRFSEPSLSEEDSEICEWIPTGNGVDFRTIPLPLWEDSEIGSSNTQDFGGDIFKHGVITSIAWSRLEKIRGETHSEWRVLFASVTTDSEGLFGVGSVAIPSSKSSFKSPETDRDNDSSPAGFETILSNTDLDKSWCLEDNVFDIGRGVRRKSCLLLSILQSARQDTRGEGEINELILLCSGLPTSKFSSPFILERVLSAEHCPNWVSILEAGVKSVSFNLEAHGCNHCTWCSMSFM